MNLQEHWGISHQQFPVIGMLLFSCDFFLTHSVSQGKNKQARDNYHSHGISSGNLTNVFSSGTGHSSKAKCYGIVYRQTIGYHSFVLLVFPHASDSYLVNVYYVM